MSGLRVSGRAGLLREAVHRLGGDYDIQRLLEKTFEREGCSCAPLRHEREQLEAELREVPAFQRWEAVQEEIRKLDNVEHPKLNRVSAVAIPFFRVWLFDHLKEAPLDPEALAETYVHAWMGGWRPAEEPV